MKIAPQTYYRWLACPVTPAELEEAYLVNGIVDIYRTNKSVYGVRKMWHAARRAGLCVGRDQVGRLMRIAGIQGVRRGAHRTVTTVRDDRALRHPDLVKRGWKTPNRPDAVWVADFTYVWTACGFCYVSFITDVYSRRILGWRASMSKTTDLVTAALAQALATRRRTSAEFTTEGLVHHSDAGSQPRLRAAVRVEYCVIGERVVTGGHLQRIDDQFGAHVLGHRVPDARLGVAVDHRGEVQPALPGRQIGVMCSCA